MAAINRAALAEHLWPGIIEFFGILWFIILIIAGLINLPFFLDLFAFVYFFAVSLSIWAKVRLLYSATDSMCISGR